MKKAALQYQQSSPRKADCSASFPSKIARILAHLMAGASINRFEAEWLGDHYLNSTIAVLANRHGLIFKRQSESTSNRLGAPCTVIRYSLPVSECDKASKVLAYLCRTTSRTNGS